MSLNGYLQARRTFQPTLARFLEVNGTELLTAAQSQELRDHEFVAAHKPVPIPVPESSKSQESCNVVGYANSDEEMETSEDDEETERPHHVEEIQKQKKGSPSLCTRAICLIVVVVFHQF